MNVQLFVTSFAYFNVFATDVKFIHHGKPVSEKMGILKFWQMMRRHTQIIPPYVCVDIFFIAFYPIDVTIKDGKRWSTYKAFIQPVLGRNNLKVVRYAHVKRVRRIMFTLS